MATPQILQTEQDVLMYSSLFPKDENVRPRGVEIEKKIEYLESLAGNVNFLILFIYLFMVNCNLCFLYGRLKQSPAEDEEEIQPAPISDTIQDDPLLVSPVRNRRSRRWLNDRLLMELVPRLNAEEIRGLFAPPPWGEEGPPSAFCMTKVGEWDSFRNIDMDKEASIMESVEKSSSKRRDRQDADKVAVLTAWHRVDGRTREALRRCYLTDLVSGYEECVRSFVNDSRNKNVLVMHVQDPFHRLLLHGVCEISDTNTNAFVQFYNLVSTTVAQSKGGTPTKTTKIKKKQSASSELLPKITLCNFLKMAKEGFW
ncbi:hypothetical protein SASPL_137620 [Salvia splendens]|uniref:R3H-associated N-terminal domain-containing protein n=1 Tax=Salvia splendens TaxID=180675 RepID=A0A8X8WTQ6_SALSN|nr:hypothetical protein SASPL_137620 [Salvia splendens]